MKRSEVGQRATQAHACRFEVEPYCVECGKVFPALAWTLPPTRRVDSFPRPVVEPSEQHAKALLRGGKPHAD